MMFLSPKWHLSNAWHNLKACVRPLGLEGGEQAYRKDKITILSFLLTVAKEILVV